MQTDIRRALAAAFFMAVMGLAAWALAPTHFLADRHPREKLAQVIPTAFGDWQIDRSIVPVPPSPELQEVIDKTYDETLSLTYRNSSGQRIMLSLAYGRNQHKGMNTHRPEVCYPAQGFKLARGSQPARIDAVGRSIDAVQLVAEAPGRREPITYWLMVGDEITHFGYPQRLVSVRWGLSGLIPDGVLVRVSSIDKNDADAFLLQQRFIRELLGALPANRLPRLLGSV